MTINFDLAYYFLSKILHFPISYFSVPPKKKHYQEIMGGLDQLQTYYLFY